MSEELKHEIVIIKRGGHGDHDVHHGGVWKIAFADFMTAMMAFFLVMWLISANDKTRASVARYFNPVRLVDATTQPRGLHDTKKDESGITATPDNKKADDKKEKPGKEGQDEKPEKAGKEAKEEAPAAREKRLDVALRENPFAALAEIAAEKKPGDPGNPLVAKASALSSGQRGGEAYRDPFAPPPSPTTADDPETASEPAKATAAAASPLAAVAKSQPVGTPPDPRAEKRSEDLKAITAALKPRQEGRDGPQIDVKQTEEGLVLSLTDTANFSMFGNGSAVPARKLVLMMEHVAKILKARQGKVVVRGFTDNKPYRSGRYDNWHLSLDRAQVSHYMLVRGGLEDTRFGHVEGYADRSAKSGTDPSSPTNRRIEILLKDPS